MADRREFLSSSAALALSLAAPVPAQVRGRVSARGIGVSGAAVSDGLSTTLTDANGHFELVTDRNRARFAFVSLPTGYRVPVDESGLARIYRPLAFDFSSEAAVEFQLEVSDSTNENHRFLVFGDTQIATADEADELDRAMKDVDRDALFGVTCGDLVHDAMDLFPRYRAAVASLGVPFFQAVGNHDLDPARGSMRRRSTFENYFGPTHYSFNVSGIHYVVFDNVLWLGDGYVGFLDEDQLSWLASDLASVEPGSTIAVFAHIPFLSTVSERSSGKIAKREGEVTNRDRLLEILSRFRAHFVTAHTHESEHLFHGRVHEHVVSTVCGAWWSGPICWDGTPNGYHVYEARSGELRWSFRPTGLGDRQLRVHGAGADPARPGEIVANVWNWDPKWTVVWYEDGVRRGEMVRARGLDPTAVALYQGSERPRKNPEWVEPVPTDHLFYARPSGGAVAVEVVDRFGRTFSSTLEEG
jgi:hypothetical protein